MRQMQLILYSIANSIAYGSGERAETKKYTFIPRKASHTLFLASLLSFFTLSSFFGFGFSVS